MGKPVLLLRLEGPLQSWGVRSRWDVRDTGLEPTKSGVIGLLGCALGHPMHDPRLEELSDAMRFGVRVEHPGVVVTDYQTITDFLPTAAGQYKSRGGVKSLEAIRREGDAPATIISPRAYLEDAAFLVALENTGQQPELLKRCADALRRPTWPLFLGRKACVPTRPIFDPKSDGLTERYSGVKDALLNHPWSWLGARYSNRRLAREEIQTSNLMIYIEDSSGPLVRQDAVRVNAARVYGFRHAEEHWVRLSDVCQDGAAGGVS